MKVFTVAFVIALFLFPVFPAGESYPELLDEIQPAPAAFQVVEGRPAGSAVVRGTAVTRGSGAYLKVLRAEPDAFRSYFLGEAERGNLINVHESGTLLFRIGSIKDGKIRSTAAIGDRTHRAIIESIMLRSPLELEISIPLYAGTEAPDAFSFAGAIRMAKGGE